MKLDPIVERACTWSLNTIIWSYHSAVIIKTNIKEEGRKFEKKELKKLSEIGNPDAYTRHLFSKITKSMSNQN